MGTTAKRRPGDKLGNWILKELIGSGGNGYVWRVQPADGSGEDCALKLLKRTDTRVLARFKSEIGALKLAQHVPGIVPLLDEDLNLRTSAGPRWYVMPLASPAGKALDGVDVVGVVDAFVPLVADEPESDPWRSRGVAARPKDRENSILSLEYALAELIGLRHIGYLLGSRRPGGAWMRAWPLIVSAIFLAGLPAASPAQSLATPSGRPAVDGDGPSSLAGKWTYRSFHNDAALVDGDPDKALRLIFAEAEFNFQVSPAGLKGTLDWPGGGLDLKGTVTGGVAGAPLAVEIVGTGRPGTDTAGWEYDYRGHLAYHWLNGVNQVPALVGSVLRAKPHNGAPAGYSASFVAVKAR